MITRFFTKEDAVSEAVYSDCENYRYSLTRIWEERGARALFVMLNPSTATEVQNDPTVERCERRARALGFGGFRVTNIFAWRDTDPQKMRAAADPIGPTNDDTIRQSALEWIRDSKDQIVCAWGAHGDHLSRGAAVEKILRDTGKDLYSLGLTKQGHPKHPLYIGYSVQPEIWHPR
ncbi:DUF1643 domain-containing protein [Marivivens sp. LCG002]|uniref:DUF1643 domain-containing protein n=1 Tax=Marivivens sp. LCG002 TaxID=3051171 RepID=UPI0025549B21|nr:DUF1643 domain-containing protein [Marivivens sp. LCG002]WIV50627.1 DUF1643 domain-containing protein [Marivivens sp. LCG002]